ncbi:MAG TPA: hypothetical protein VER33_05400 [Polyangiaceae bacterium]|nr:hypothetical protein [Polyangiaceae bacterium]
MATPFGAPAPSNAPDSGPEAPRTADRESGVPPAVFRHAVPPTLAARSEAHLHAALTANTRTEAGLGALLRAVQHLSATVSGASQANGEVAAELTLVREMLASSNLEQLALQHRVTLLQQALSRTEQEASRERKFLLEEHDAFIAALWTDHMREMNELRQKLDASTNSARDTARDVVQRLQSQRDEAQTTLLRLTAERDAAREELERHRARMAGSSSEPALSDAASQSTQQRATREKALAEEAHDRASAELAEHRLKGTTLVSLVEPSASSRQRAEHGDARRRGPAFDAFPQEELAIPATPTSEPPLPSRPDPASRHLIGYSVSGHDLAEEVLEGTRSSSRPPER